jgi:hypothetical protein
MWSGRRELTLRISSVALFASGLSSVLAIFLVPTFQLGEMASPWSG